MENSFHVLSKFEVAVFPTVSQRPEEAIILANFAKLYIFHDFPISYLACIKKLSSELFMPEPRA